MARANETEIGQPGPAWMAGASRKKGEDRVRPDLGQGRAVVGPGQPRLIRARPDQTAGMARVIHAWSLVHLEPEIDHNQAVP